MTLRVCIATFICLGRVVPDSKCFWICCNCWSFWNFYFFGPSRQTLPWDLPFKPSIQAFPSDLPFRPSHQTLPSLFVIWIDKMSKQLLGIVSNKLESIMCIRLVWCESFSWTKPILVDSRHTQRLRNVKKAAAPNIYFQDVGRLLSNVR